MLPPNVQVSWPMQMTWLTIVKKRRISFGGIQGEQPGDQEQRNTQNKQSQHFRQGKGSTGGPPTLKEGGAPRGYVVCIILDIVTNGDVIVRELVSLLCRIFMCQATEIVVYS